MRQSLKRFLLRRIPDHHTVFEAVDGNEAITIYDRVMPDWVLMDVEMKPMDGLTASRVILQSHPNARIIVLTSFDNVSYREAAQKAGAMAYVLKTNLSELKSLLSISEK
jgi:DNA-binding NarL/FixJ family response regulator